MSNVGIVRALDSLGRVVIPITARKRLGINPTDSLEILETKDGIFIKKYNPRCHCCGKGKDLKEICDVKLCDDCIKKFEEIRVAINNLR